MSPTLEFTVFARPVPQGSMRGFVLQGKNGGKPRAIVTSDNKKLMPYRQELARTVDALMEEKRMERPFAGKHIPVEVWYTFYFARPKSCPKKRTHCVVAPDVDKSCRSTSDALTGFAWHDDAQIVKMHAEKLYGSPERAEIRIRIMGDTHGS